MHLQCSGVTHLRSPTPLFTSSHSMLRGITVANQVIRRPEADSKYGAARAPPHKCGIWGGVGAPLIRTLSRFLNLLFLLIIRRDDMFLFALKVAERALHIIIAIGVPVANQEWVQQLQ